jgi:ATP-dependent RNA helicase
MVEKTKKHVSQDENMVIESNESLTLVQSFDELRLNEQLLRGLYAYGFDKPSAVQKRAIFPIIKRRDVIVQSQSGTGKTCVFTLGALQNTDLAVREPQVLILSPTRELAEQTQKVCMALGDYMQVKVHCCIGGRNVNDDVFKLEHGTHIVSGTPGRVFDMIQRRTFKTNSIKMLILDEADEMLNAGFKDQVYDIYRYLPPNIQCVVVSATLPQEILDMTNKFMNDPLKILVKRDELTLDGIK